MSRNLDIQEDCLIVPSYLIYIETQVYLVGVNRRPFSLERAVQIHFFGGSVDKLLCCSLIPLVLAKKMELTF